MEINIKGIDKIALAKALYDRARPQGLGYLHFKEGGLSDEEALALAGADWLDYVRGRVMKTSVVGDAMRSDFYDRDNGPGAAQEAINAVLNDMVNP